MRLLFALCLFLVPWLATAETPEDIARAALAKVAPKASIDSVKDSQIPGFYQVVAGGHFLYVSKDGKYLIDGNAYDVAARRDLTELGRSDARRIALAKIGPDKRITFAPKAKAAPARTVTVFTDVDCPYCRRFHEQIAQYTDKGIQVDYLFFPLSIHPGADKKAEAVWCASDRQTAFTAAMLGKDTGTATCANPVAELSKLAQTLGIGGTPTFIGPDGSQINAQIALQPDQLVAELDRIAAAGAKK